eukprot:Pgem_evm1s15678
MIKNNFIFGWWFICIIAFSIILKVKGQNCPVGEYYNNDVNPTVCEQCPPYHTCAGGTNPP